MAPWITEILKAAAAPSACITILFFVSGGLKDPLRARLQSLVWALGFVMSCYLLLGHLSFPPADVNEAFAWGALALMAFVIISPRPMGSRYLARAVFVLLLGWLALWPLRDSLHGPTHMRNLLAFFFLGLGTWSILEKASQSVQPLTLVTLPLLSSVALTELLVLKGGTSMAVLCGILCLMLFAVAVVAVIQPRRVSVAAVLPFISVLVVLFMTSGHFYLHINPWFMIFLSWPFLVLWIRRGIPLVPRTAIAEAVCLGILAAAPLGYFLWTILNSRPLF